MRVSADVRTHNTFQHSTLEHAGILFACKVGLQLEKGCYTASSHLFEVPLQYKV